jgi:branched-chain amino acid transport system ATP-binding protein
MSAMAGKVPATDRGATICVAGVTAEYFPGQPILSDLTIAAETGKVTVILGPNGSGKSTTLRVLAGLLRPRAGEVTITFGGRTTDLIPVAAYERSHYRIAYLTQGHSIFPGMTVHDNLMIGAWPIRKDRQRVEAAIASVYERYPMLRERRKSLAASLSGGQQRILEVARLLVPDPAVVLVDEPSAGVAPAIAAAMYEELRRLREEGRTVVLVDQDVRPALAIADTVYTLRSGRNDRSGPAEQFAGDVAGIAREWLAVPGDST